MKRYKKSEYRAFTLRIYEGRIGEDLLVKCCREHPEKDPDFQMISSSSYSRVFKLHHNRQEYFYKAFLNRNIVEPIKTLFRGSRARRSLHGDQLLLDHGFKVPRCILLGRKGNLHFTVSEAVPGARNLIQFVKEELAGSPHLTRNQINLKKQLSRQLGMIIGQMHARGIIHGDLRWGNVLVQETAAKHFAIWFVDNERTSFHGKGVPTNKRLKNLVQMNMTLEPVITNMDRMIFFRAYLAENKDLLPCRNDLAVQVRNRTNLRLAKYTRL